MGVNAFVASIHSTCSPRSTADAAAMWQTCSTGTGWAVYAGHRFACDAQCHAFWSRLLPINERWQCRNAALEGDNQALIHDAMISSSRLEVDRT